ncbi:MAG: hypothetical protein VB045_01705 [Synergistaceae bacterium]|nr:hypothetical protein [Synergistaceae bacterium]
MDAPLIVTFSPSERACPFPLSPDFSKAGGFFALSLSLPEEEGRKAALSRGCHLLCGGKKSLTVLDDGGAVLLRYGGLHGGEGPREGEFPLFYPGGLMCALSLGYDILFPEHARLLALGGAEFLLFIPPPSKDRDLLRDFTRIRAAENQVFTALVPPEPDLPLFFGPGGETLTPESSFDGGWISLERRVLQRERKKLPLRSLRRQELYHGLTAL